MDDAAFMEAHAEIIDILERIDRLPPLLPIITKMQRAETVGPLVNPGLFAEAAPNMRTVRKLTEALHHVKAEIGKYPLPTPKEIPL